MPIYLDCKPIYGNKRQGTHATLHRGLVSGSTRKIKRQKGTWNCSCRKY